MRKLVVLMLVLGMASLANASLVLTINGGLGATVNVGDTVTLALDSTTTDAMAYIDVLLGGGTFTLSEPVAGAALGDMGSVSRVAGTTELGYEEIFAQQAWAPTASNPVSGRIVTVSLVATGEGQIALQLWDNAIGYSEPAQTGIINVIPEPATMLILGLGGLLLRRKK